MSHTVCSCAAEANSLVSSDNELPFDYYSMPFCMPDDGIKKSLSSVNPGTILTGSRILNSPYNFTVLVRKAFPSFVLEQYELDVPRTYAEGLHFLLVRLQKLSSCGQSMEDFIPP